MKKTFTLENLDCANCAAKLERKVSKTKGVDSCTVSFMTSKMEIEAADDKIDEVVEEAKRVITKLEPNVVVKDRR